ncbi:hypothetical protein F5Y17DRAFT_419202 [Xylariaceae sp. FL0594]|nr:hypothetical protein F5Y17DRAFT_419202 [Xylariaceae sp. FL0594]
MAPINFLPAVDGTVRRLLDASTAIKSTRALPETINKILKRQSDGSSGGGSSGGDGNSGGAPAAVGTHTSTLDGGSIAGIVIGSIVGILLLYWIIRSCSNWSSPGGWGGREPEKPPRSSAYYDPPRQRSRSRHSHHSHHRHHSRSPRRIEVVQPVAYEPRGRSPRAPPVAYYSGGSRRSSDARRYSGY